MTLKKIFITTIVVLSVVLLLFQEYVFTTINTVVDLQQNDVIEYTTQKIEDSILSKLETLGQLRSHVNWYMYDYLVSEHENNYSGSPSRSLIENLEKPTSILSDSIYYIAFSGEKSYKFSSGLTDTEIRYIRNCCDVFRTNQAITLHDYDFFVLDNDGYNDLYICIMSNIYKTTYHDIGREYVATYAICSKLNLNELTLLEQRFENLDLKLVSQDNVFNLLSTNNHNKIVQTIDYKIPNTQYSLQGVLHQNNTISTTYKISKTVLIETIFLILMFVAIIILLELYVTIPIKKIIQHIQNTTIFTKPAPLRLKTISEFKTITTYINSMVTENRNLAQRIVKTQQQLYEIEIEKYKSDLVSLENQINPHFLYNTLECVRSIAVINDISEIEEIVTHLSDIMRYSVKANNFVPLSHELSVVDMYLKIMTIRFPKLQNIVINADDKTLSAQVPKMILQPIVENIFKHAITASSNLSICISVKNSNNDLIISIKDTGQGIPPEKLSAIQSLLSGNADISNENIGLLNVDRRIKLHFGNEYGIKIDSKLNEYTVVTIRMGQLRTKKNDSPTKKDDDI